MPGLSGVSLVRVLVAKPGVFIDHAVAFIADQGLLLI